MRVYVAGSISEVEYRQYVAEKYSDKLDLFDPLKEIEAGVFGIDIKEIKKLETYQKFQFSKDEIGYIVEKDKEAVKNSNIVTAYMTKYSAGTIMEILHAWNHIVPVYTIDPFGHFRNDVWISYHTTRFFDTIDECYDRIIEVKFLREQI